MWGKCKTDLELGTGWHGLGNGFKGIPKVFGGSKSFDEFVKSFLGHPNLRRSKVMGRVLEIVGLKLSLLSGMFLDSYYILNSDIQK